MIITAAFVLSAVVFGCITKYKYGWRDCWSAGLMVLSGLASLFAFTYACVGIPKDVPTPDSPVVFPIVQLKENSSDRLVGGGSFLGWTISGDSKMRYVVFEKRGGCLLRTFHDQDSTYVVESGETPHVAYRSFSRSYPKLWNMPWFWNDGGENMYWTREATIFVPADTVQVKFEGL